MAGNLNKRLGRYVSRSTTGEAYKAFVPAALPPEPPLDMDKLYQPLEQAVAALGGLEALAKLLPDATLFLFMYVRKEALVSSQIEGTQSSLADLLLYEEEEAPSVPVDDVEEVSNYIAALHHGIKAISKIPISSRLIRECHAILLRGGRGANKCPGEFRRSQNWIGGTRPGKASFVPPPPEMVDGLIADMEKFVHNDRHPLPILIKAALVHVQFETIHPFLDGNGRLGRLLITLMLCAESVISEPILYLSLYFKEHRQTYYDLLQGVRLKGDWESWCEFFLEGVAATATQAQQDAKLILKLIEKDRAVISKIGRASTSGLKLHNYILSKPYISIAKASKDLELSVPAVTNTVEKLVEEGILNEVTGKAKNRLFAYKKYLDILIEGTEPL